MLFNILVSIKPIAFIVAALLPSHADEVKVLLPTDKDMHEYALTVADLQNIEHAETLFWLGAKSEPFLAKLEQRLSSQKQSQKQPQKHWVPLVESPHSWLDVAQVKQMTQAMAVELAKIYPKEKNTIDRNAALFLQKLSARNSYWQKLLTTYSNKPFLLGHDAFLPFAQNIGLKQGLMYRASNDHGHAQAGAYELLDLQKRIMNEEIVCALEEPEVDFKQLAKRFPQLKIGTLDIMATSIKISPNAYIEFLDLNASAFQRCLQ